MVSYVQISLTSSLIRILTQFGIENYGLKFGIILKISVNIADFYSMTLDSNCDDTFRPTCVDNLRQ